MNLLTKISLSIIVLTSFSYAECSSCVEKKRETYKQKLEVFLSDSFNEKEILLLKKENSGEANYKLGLIYLSEHEKEKAIKFFKKSIKQKYFQAYHNLAILSDSEEEKIRFFKKSIEYGFEKDLLNLFIASSNVNYLKEAVEKRIPEAYFLASKYFFHKHNGENYAKLAYDKKKSFYEHFIYTKDKNILIEGVKYKDLDCIAYYSSQLIDNKEYKKVMEITKNIQHPMAIFNRIKILMTKEDYRNAILEVNKFNSTSGYFSYLDINLKEKVDQIENKICSISSACLSF